MNVINRNIVFSSYRSLGILFIGEFFKYLVDNLEFEKVLEMDLISLLKNSSFLTLFIDLKHINLYAIVYFFLLINFCIYLNNFSDFPLIELNKQNLFKIFILLI